MPDTEFVYKVTAGYDPVAERGVIWNDRQLALPWPISAEEAILSAKDLTLPGLAEATQWSF
jgi:dTDP-4-dehydrorhamnose 3,5-epimerase